MLDRPLGSQQCSSGFQRFRARHCLPMNHIATMSQQYIAVSALPPKADMCSAIAHVCFGPIADMAQTQVQFFISSRTDGLRRLHQMAVTAIQTREPSNDER